MQSTGIIANWPGNIQNSDELLMLSFKDWNVKDMEHNGIVAVTEGWREGSVACVLRGGVNAVAVLQLLSMSGFKDIKIYHLEEKLNQMEDIFTQPYWLMQTPILTTSISPGETNPLWKNS